jgi:hypothetical protein
MNGRRIVARLGKVDTLFRVSAFVRVCVRTVNDFRESHTGTLSGMTRYEDHLDDMPASGCTFTTVQVHLTLH